MLFFIGENRYYPDGETRLTTGTIFTDKLFTGQREMRRPAEGVEGAGWGIYHDDARFYSPKLGKFLSPNTIVMGFPSCFTSNFPSKRTSSITFLYQ